MDSAGKPLEANIAIEVYKNPFELANDPTKGLQMWLQPKCLQDIKAGSECDLYYGDAWHREKRITIPNLNANQKRQQLSLDDGEYSDLDDSSPEAEQKQKPLDLQDSQSTDDEERKEVANSKSRKRAAPNSSTKQSRSSTSAPKSHDKTTTRLSKKQTASPQGCAFFDFRV